MGWGGRDLAFREQGVEGGWVGTRHSGRQWGERVVARGIQGDKGGGQGWYKKARPRPIRGE